MSTTTGRTSSPQERERGGDGTAAARRAPAPLACTALRWRCEEGALPFASTADVEPERGVVGQESALEALRFGVRCRAPGQNIYVRGLVGSGRMMLVRRILEGLEPKPAELFDRVYVHNFTQPDRPRLISLPPGKARSFRRQVQRLAEFVRTGLRQELGAEAVRARHEAIQRRDGQQIERLTQPFEKRLAEAGMALVSVNMGGNAQAAIFPLVDGKPVAPEELDGLREDGRIDEERLRAWAEKREEFAKELGEIGLKIAEIRGATRRALEDVVSETARTVLLQRASALRAEYRDEAVGDFVRELIAEVVEAVVAAEEGALELVLRFIDVNVVLCHEDPTRAPIVVENLPTATNLFGTVDREWTAQGPVLSTFRMVRPGSLLRADGGFLVLDARDVLTEPGAWKALVRTLRTGLLEIVPSDSLLGLWQQSTKPDPIPVSFRVVLVGDADLYYLLDGHDADFAHQFKVLADFDQVIESDAAGLMQYAGVLSRIAREEGLPHFARCAVAALAEHGVRIASAGGMLTTRFHRVADLAREAAFLAGERGAELVERPDVESAVRRTKARADLPSRRFRKLVREGTIHVSTSGLVVGQINGLAVIHAGPLVYGFPARITATIGPGSAGIVDIEGRAALSGSIHTKGVQILGGLVRHLLRAGHPLAFSASLAFEQSYGGIDGDSASGAEVCCLLSALADVPLRQDLAMTGAIDQFGRIQAIGGVNEKIEGFYDACADFGLSGTQGVIIPLANARDLMLREDVARACAAGKFKVWAVESIHQALELFTGMPAGERDEEGSYPEGTLLRLAVDAAENYWRSSLANPALELAYEEGEADDESEKGEDEEDIAAEA